MGVQPMTPNAGSGATVGIRANLLPRMGVGSRNKWSPASLGDLVAWFYADAAWLTLDEDNDVLEWRDRSGNGNHIKSTDLDFHPQYEFAGWNSDTPAVNFNLNDSHELLRTDTAGGLVNLPDGSNNNMTVFLTVQLIGTIDLTDYPFVAWRDPAGTSLIECGQDDGGQPHLRYRRRNAAGTDQQDGGGIALGNNRHRVAFVYGAEGVATDLKSYLDADPDQHADFSGVGGTIASTRFEMGTAGFNFRIVEAVFYSTAKTQADFDAYRQYSHREFGDPMTITPEWIATGASSTGAGPGGITPAYGTNATGDLFLLQLIIRTETVAPATPAGWTLQDGPDPVGPIRQYWYTRDSRSTGGESGTITIGSVTGDSILAVIHTFRNVATSAFFESLSTAGESTSPARQTIEAPTVTPTGTGRLACCLIAISNNAAVVTSFTGESGGDWVIRAYAGSSIGSNCELALQTAALETGATISGGSCANSDDEYMLHGFALVGGT